MNLSSKSIETLIDLVEVRISTIVGVDRKDIRAINRLTICLRELKTYVADKPESVVMNFLRAY